MDLRNFERKNAMRRRIKTASVAVVILSLLLISSSYAVIFLPNERADAFLDKLPSALSEGVNQEIVREAQTVLIHLPPESGERGEDLLLEATVRNRPPPAISRDHRVTVSRSGLVTIIGGKWTTYRRMGEAVVDRAATVGGLEKRPCQTRTLRLRGWVEPGSRQVHAGACRADDRPTGDPAKEGSGPDRLLHPELPYRAHEVLRAVREEMARSVEDVLARRTRSLLLNARASIEAAPVVARLMAREMGRDEQWLQDQVSAYRDLARRYVL